MSAAQLWKTGMERQILEIRSKDVDRAIWTKIIKNYMKPLWIRGHTGNSE